MHTKDIWWKKYMTMMQMAQFICMNGQVSTLHLTYAFLKID